MRASELDPWPASFQPARDGRHGPISKLTLAKIDSKVSVRRLQRLKLAALTNPPTAAIGPFPFRHRTLAQVRADKLTRMADDRAEESRVDQYWDERWARDCAD